MSEYFFLSSLFANIFTLQNIFTDPSAIHGGQKWRKGVKGQMKNKSKRETECLGVCANERERVRVRGWGEEKERERERERERDGKE